MNSSNRRRSGKGCEGNTARLSEAERQELLDLAHSETFRQDLRRLPCREHPPSEVAPDEFLAWLQAYNESINHAPKPERPLLDRNMKL